MFNDDELVYFPENAKYPLLELDKLFLLEEEQFKIYCEKYLEYFQNDLERLQLEKEKNLQRSWQYQKWKST